MLHNKIDFYIIFVTRLIKMNKDELSKYLSELSLIYEQLDGPPLELGICGGAALILTDLIDRVTKDIDTLFPTPWPPLFSDAATIVARTYGLSQEWINSGPAMLTSMGLPEGFEKRAHIIKFNSRLTVLFASRYDQIFFKVYAAADRGGYHVDDLLALNPTQEEILAAAQWCRNHDPSDGFLAILTTMLEALGYGEAAKKI